MDKKLLDILVCPLCKGPLIYDKDAGELICKPDRLAYPIRDDMPAMLIRQAADDLAAHEAASIATLRARLTAGAELFDPNVVKVVMDRAGYALYFSRAPIPWDRAAFGRDGCGVTEVSGYWRHLGMYAYRAGFLQ